MLCTVPLFNGLLSDAKERTQKNWQYLYSTIGIGQKRRADDINQEIVTLNRPTEPEELQLVKDSGFKKWPPRLPEQPIFYSVTNEQYAKDIATQWNIKDSGVGYVTRFDVKRVFMERYKVEQVGARHHTEWWIPAEELDELNENIVGDIEVIGEYK